MATEITMPKLGLTMEEGTIVEWVAKPGQSVRQGDTIMVIETEKSNVEVEAEADGVIQQVVAEGETADVEAVLGYVLEAGESVVDT